VWFFFVVNICAYIDVVGQHQAFWDATGKIWMEGSLAGKYAGVFMLTSSTGGGQESTAVSFMSTLVHQGIIFVPFGYASGFRELMSLEEVHGGELKKVVFGGWFWLTTGATVAVRVALGSWDVCWDGWEARGD
jgi:hypothetical protein